MEFTSRRSFMKYSGVAGITALAGCLGDDDEEEEYPSQSITQIIPYDPGGGTDIYLRQVGQYFPEYLGVDATYENIPGAGGMNGISEAAQADPDGYTVVGVNPPSEVLPWLLDEDVRAQVDITELEPVASVGFSAYVLIGHADHEFDGYSDVIDRFADGEFSSIGGTEAGGASQMCALLLRDQMDLEWDEYVAYEGASPVVEAVASGEIPVGLPTSGAAQPAVEEGLVEPIVMIRAEGDGIFPDTPSVTDEGYDNIDFVGAVTRSVMAPPDTPEDRINVLSEGYREIVESDEMEEWSDETGQGIAYLDPEETRAVWQGGIETLEEEIDLDAIREQL